MISIKIPQRIRTAKTEGSPFFDIKDVPSLRADTMAPTGDRYIINSVTDKIMGKVAAGYQITTHQEASNMVRQFLDNTGLPYESQGAVSANGGKKFYETIVFPSLKFNLGRFGASTALDNTGLSVDDVLPVIQVRGSYDKTTATTFDYQWLRLVCLNGMTRPHGTATQLSFRHNAVVNPSLVQGEMIKNLEQSSRFLEIAYQKMNTTEGLEKLNVMLNSISFSDKFKKAVLDKASSIVELDMDVKVSKTEGIIGRKEELVEWNIRKVDTKASDYCLYNIMTDISTHELPFAERTKTDKAIANLYLADVE